MTQLIPSVSSGKTQTFRNGVSPVLKCVLGVVFGLACLLLFLPGMADAKGGGSRGGHSHHAHRSGKSGKNYSQSKHHHPIHKHKHKHKKKDGDSDGGGDGGGDEGGDDGGDSDGGSSDGGAAESSGGAEAAEAAEAVPVVYGMEITTLYKGAAAKGGLEIGDIIMSVNGTSTPTFEALAQALAGAGNRAQLVVIREDGGERETVTLYPQNGYIGVSAEPARVE